MINLKNIRFRSGILYLLIIAFFIGIGFFVYEFINKAHLWAFSPVNHHSANIETYGGKITDTNGLILAQTINGKRVYSENEEIRKALLHVIGDGIFNIPTSVQSRYSSELFGYNRITGFGAPEIFNINKDISLTVDAQICAKVSKSFKDKKGAAVAYNYLTGDILCMVSLPTYDVNNKPIISNENKEKYEGVYINRVFSSAYTPGSIFKIFTAIAALDEVPDIEKRTFNCSKIKIIDGEKVSCMSNHGNLDLKNAMAKSCDILFGDLGIELGKDKMRKKMDELGFNKPQYFEGIEIANSEYEVNDASQADLAWSAIGQYIDKVNPLHMMKIMGAIANSGTCVEPKLVKSIFSKNSNSPEKLIETSNFTMINPETAEKIKDIMRYTVKNSSMGSLFPNLQICAKTGTAEVGERKLPHGWIVGFSKDEKLPIAFAVVVENGDFGIKSAGPIASLIMKECSSKFNSKKYS